MYDHNFRNYVSRISEAMRNVRSGKKTLNESVETEPTPQSAGEYKVGDVVRSRLNGRVGTVKGHALNEHVVVKFNGEPFTRTTHNDNIRPVKKDW